MSRRKGRSLNREKVVETAYRLVQQEGADALGLNRTARALDIKPPSMYNHVANNEDLRTAVAQKGWEQFVEALDDSLETREVSSFVDFLAICREIYRQNLQVFLVSFSNHMENPNSPHQEMVEQVSGRLQKVLRGLGLSEESTHPISGMLFPMLHGFITMDAATTSVGTTADHYFEWTARLVQEGLHSLNTSPASLS